MHDLRDVPVPLRMRNRPRDHRGYVVPFFVGYVHGKPDFRTIAEGRVEECYRLELCWLCGQKLGKHRWFCIGPMCAANKITSEPPSHYECALFAVQACPHLTMPHAKRREANLPEDIIEAPGMPVKTNPGAIVLWETRDYTPVRQRRGFLFQLGEPLTQPEWWTEGRRASRQEAVAAYERSCQTLLDMAEAEADKDGTLDALHAARLEVLAARRYLPAREDAR